MLNYHILKTQHVPAKNYASAMVKITSDRFRQSHKIPYEGSSDNETAIKWLKEQGHSIIGQGEGNGFMYIISETFQPLK